jgi:hypothetical protein
MASTGYIKTLDADGQTEWVTVHGPVRLSLTGTFGSGTAKLQARTPEYNTAVDVKNGSFTAVTDTLFDFPAKSETDVRVDLSGSTSPLLVVWIQGNAPHH